MTTLVLELPEPMRKPERVTLSQTIAAVFQFARHPTPERWSQEEARRWFLPLFILHYGIVKCVAPLTYIVIAQLHTRQFPHRNVPLYVFNAVVLAPLLEETAHRLSLRFGKARLCIGVGLLCALYVPQLFSVPQSARGGWYVVTGVLSVLCYGLLWIPRVNRAALAVWTRFFPHFVWASTLFFAAGHILNYNLFAHAGPALVLTPLLATTQFFSGWILAFARVRFGIGWSMAQHAAFNAVSNLLTLLETPAKK